MNKYVFPGADASCALNWVIGRVSNFPVPSLIFPSTRVRHVFLPHGASVIMIDTRRVISNIPV
jgi:hypothetical protein